MTLKYVKKIKGAADKNGTKNGTSKRSLNGLLALVVKSHRFSGFLKMGWMVFLIHKIKLIVDVNRL